jgi:hypothetical protein
LCLIASKLGVPIIAIKELKAFHYGFPTKLTDFVKREAWHGYQDTSSIQELKNSKTALLSLGTAIIFLSLLTAGVLTGNVQLLLLSAAFLASISLLFYCLKVSSSLKAIRYWPIATAYLLGRFMSIVLRFTRKPNRSPSVPSGYFLSAYML